MKSLLLNFLSAAIRNPHSAIRHSAVIQKKWPQSAIVLVFAALLAISWRRWISPVTDSGREMDLPIRLMNGELLYRDVYYLYPPFSPYFHSLLYRIFGAHLDVLQAGGAICAVLVVWMCYRIARRLMTPSESALAVIAVIVVCVFKPGGNLIWPYSFAALHGMVFALGALLVALRYAENEKRRELVVAGVLIGLGAITKQEFAVAAVCAVTAAVAWLRRADFKRLVTDLALTAASASLVALPIYAAMLAFIGWKIIVEDCHLFYTHLPTSLIFYNAQRAGLDFPLISFAQMIGAAAVGVAMLSAAALLGGALMRRRQDRQTRWIWIALDGALLVALAIRLIAGEEWDGSPMRALPFLSLGMIVVGWRRWKQVGADGAALFIIAVYSLAILARVALRVPSGGAFGGFFLPTSLVLFCYLFLRAAPEAVGRWAQDRSVARRTRLIGAGMLITLLAATAVVYGARYRRNFNYELKTPRGDLFVRRPIGKAFREALDFIAERSDLDDAIAVLPEGSDLAFLGERRMALRLQIFHPGFLDERGERAEIARLQAARARYALIVNRSMHEFGADAFGRDYFPTLGQWIDEHYRLVKVCGESQDERLQIGDPVFFVKILENRSGGL
ncbi:MAG TPA: glycosyltransferase family 39 protein [Blastocatellia bacterium]|jgi:4-amino-4-deoxy-L-arabinose transferase-like glycosyltransferase|nr:glycosyltransferase family 39 protein [Blastocatellia bacterium]